MYYLRQQTKISGPFTVEQVQVLLRKGRVARSDKISTDRLEWLAIGSCPEICEHPAPPVVESAAEPEPAAAGDGGDGGDEWFFAMGGAQQPSPVGMKELQALISSGRVGPTDMVWKNGFSDWRMVSTVPELASVAGSPAPTGSVAFPPTADPLAGSAFGGGGAPAAAGGDYKAFVAKKVPAGILALLMGTLGIHKFMLGLTTGGIVMLVLFFLLLPIPVLSLIAFVEGITYLTKSDERFYEDYAVRKKQWF
jgi:TM2 domain-containing membrane protein YozV